VPTYEKIKVTEKIRKRLSCKVHVFLKMVPFTKQLQEKKAMLERTGIE
jgi:hypothetical protein